MAAKEISTDEWKDITWKKIERNVFKLQKRIHQASSRNDKATVRKLQRLLMKSRSARLLAVRRVTQDNQGKKTAGIDGKKSLTPKERLKLSENLKIGEKAKPLRRIWIDKRGTTEKRPLGIPTIEDRAIQALVKSALEPEWEAKFEPNSYGFRPGRSVHDAIEAIYNAVSRKTKYVLDADIAKCFDKIDHAELLKKADVGPSMRKQIKAWLKAGVMDQGELYPTKEGTPQGGVISPLLANIALHGLETAIKEEFRKEKGARATPPNTVVYADDFIVLHNDLEVVKRCQQHAEQWLKQIGLELKPSKTKIVHSLEKKSDQAGVDFLGFNIRQYKVGKRKSGKDAKGKLLGYKALTKPSKEAVNRHIKRLKETIRKHRSRQQEELIEELNPMIKGWTNYYATAASKEIFAKTDHILFKSLLAWAKRRHPDKGIKWAVDKYWRMIEQGRWNFQARESKLRLYRHQETKVRRYVKVEGSRSPYDGDWIYWSVRMGRNPEVSPRVSKLLKKQKGKCPECGLLFKDGDEMEVDHIIPKKLGGLDVYMNLQLLHNHCHDVKTARESSCERCA